MSLSKKGRMTKLMVILLAVVIMLIPAYAVSAAENFSIGLVTSSSQIKAGDQFTVTLNFYDVKNVGGLAGFGPLKIAYNSDMLTVVSAKGNTVLDGLEIFTDKTVGEISMNFVNLDGVFPGSSTGIDEICVITFKVKDGVDMSSFKMNLSMSCTDYLAADLETTLPIPTEKDVKDNLSPVISVISITTDSTKTLNKGELSLSSLSSLPITQQTKFLHIQARTARWQR
jgi:hypothetical protein